MYSLYSMLRIAFATILIGLALIHFSRFTHTTHHTPIDFRNVYLGTKIWLNGNNPYQDIVIKNEWKQICTDENIINNQPPGLPQNFLVYPPTAFILYAPFSWLNWKNASMINSILCLFALLITIHLWTKIIDPTAVSKYWLYLIVFAYKGTAAALIVGQPTFLILALGTASIYFNQRFNKSLIGGILLGLTAIKPTLMIPFFMFFLFHKQWKSLFISMIVSVGLIVMTFTLFTHHAYFIWNGFFENIKLLNQVVYAGETTYYLHSITDISVWANYLFPAQINKFILFEQLLLLISFFYIWKSNNSINSHDVFVLVSFITLLLSYHLFYDLLLLIPLVILSQSWNMKYKIIAALISLPLFLPINGILDRLEPIFQLEIAYLHLPVVLCLLLTLVLFQLKASKAVGVK